VIHPRVAALGASSLVAAFAFLSSSASAPARPELTIEGPTKCEEDARIELRAACPEAVDAKFAWKQVSGPKARFQATSGAVVALVAPQDLKDYVLEIECVATWGDQTRAARRKISVSADDDPPVAHAFVVEQSECAATLLLTGQGQNPEILQGITYEWRQIGDGPRVELEYADRPQAWCTPPEHGEPYELSFEFCVRDGVNPEAVSRVDVAIECDPRFAPLGEGQTLELPRGLFLETPLPRGAWELLTELVLEPTDPEKPAVATIRMPYTKNAAAALSFEARDGQVLVRRFSFEKDAHGEWYEPEMSGSTDLGAWTPGKPLGLSLVWKDGELAVRFGAPGDRANWPEPPFPMDMKLGSRPRSLWIGATGAKLDVNALTLRAK